MTRHPNPTRYLWVMVLFCPTLLLGDNDTSQFGVTGADETKLVTAVAISVDREQRTDNRTNFHTLGDALRKAETHLLQGQGVTITVAPGIYREGNIILRGRDWPDRARAAPLIIRGARKDAKTVFSGADVWTEGWRPVPGHPGVYRHDWNDQWGFGPNPWADRFGFVLSALTVRREVIWIDGRPQRQVLLEEAQWDDPDGNLREKPGRSDDQPGRWTYVRSLGLDALDRGTYGVIERPGADRGLYIRPDRPFRPGRTGVEVGRRSQILRINHKDNVAIQNITFEKTAGPIGSSDGVALFIHGNNILIENCTFQDNNANGLSLGNERTDMTVRNCRIIRNGWKGMGLSRPNNTLIVDTEASLNCRRGHWGEIYGWDSAATKIMGPGGPEGVRVLRYTAIGNFSHGLWFDHAEVRRAPIEVTDSIFAGNQYQSQLYIEKQPGPVVIRRNVLWGDSPRGTLLAVAHNLTLEDNLLVHTADGGFLVKLENRTNGLANESRDWQVRRNILVADGGRARLYARAGTTKPEHKLFVETLTADENIYWNPRRGNAFEAADSTYVAFPQWQQLTGQDAGSAFAEVRFADVARGDWRLIDRSLRRRFSQWPLPPRQWLGRDREQTLRR